jgi:hypothetical protein
MRWTRVLILGSVVLLCLGSPMSRSALARETWSEIGHIQILEGPEKIWVFVEVMRITDKSSTLLTSQPSPGSGRCFAADSQSVLWEGDKALLHLTGRGWIRRDIRAGSAPTVTVEIASVATIAVDFGGGESRS